MQSRGPNIAFPFLGLLTRGGIFGIAASLNLHHFIRIGGLHSVPLGFEPKSTNYKLVALPLSYEIISA